MIKAVTAVFCTLCAPAAFAQTETRVTNGQSFGAWQISCTAIAVGETACVLNQTLYRDTDNAFLAQMLAVWSSDGQKRYILARVPAGVYLPAGIAMRPANIEGEDKIVQMVWQSCINDVCEALAEIDVDMLSAFADDGVSVVASYQPSINAAPIVFIFEMSGVLEGMDAVLPTP